MLNVRGKEELPLMEIDSVRSREFATKSVLIEAKKHNKLKILSEDEIEKNVEERPSASAH